MSTLDDVVVDRVAATFVTLDGMPATLRAQMLTHLGDVLRTASEDLVTMGVEETSLTPTRLEGELERTIGQLTTYGDEMVRLGAHLERAEAGTPPVEFLRTLVGLGPVANFEASNFPFAFGALGTDTASALAAGCPVVVKAHPAHPQTSRLFVELARDTFAQFGVPDAVGIVEGDAEVATQLAQHRAIRAVTFTGSLTAGRAIMDVAAARPDPIPVYAELSSVNPIVMLEGSLVSPDLAELAGVVARSVTGSAGQLCTKPGLVVVPRGEHGDRFVEELHQHLASTPAHPFISDRIESRFHDRLSEVRAHVPCRTSGGGWLFEIAIAPFDRVLAEEIFGPATVVVRYEHLAQVVTWLRELGGQLVVSVHAGEHEYEEVEPLLAVAVHTAGRLVWGGVPTGVAVVAPMHHGGPWPAANSLVGSVGPEAVRRFLRSVTWQGFPLDAVPSRFRHATRNPTGVEP